MCPHRHDCAYADGCVEDGGIQDVKGCARYADMRRGCPGCAGKLYVRDDGRVKCGRCMAEWENVSEIEDQEEKVMPSTDYNCPLCLISGEPHTVFHDADGVVCATCGAHWDSLDDFCTALNGLAVALLQDRPAGSGMTVEVVRQ